MFDFGSQHLEIFFLPAVPTEHLDRNANLKFRCVFIYCCLVIIFYKSKVLRKVKPDLCFENLSWQLKILNKILGREKGVTNFHVAWVKCNCRRKTPNGYQKFDITEKTIILNFYYYKLKRFYNRDPFF